MQDLNVKNQTIQVGSSHLIKKNKFFDRTQHMIDNMSENLAYKFFCDKNNIFDEKKEILDQFKKKYIDYRNNWVQIPLESFSKTKSFLKDKILSHNPLCVDIELASICDLGCPHCYRDYIMTPDKIMKEELYYKIIDKISELGVPSIKLNWRGEPLLHPKIIEFITYAKKKGILEILINTNSTKLDSKMSEKIILSGLDQIIFSFDGGTKKTYEKMRPGRFKFNSFEEIYENIKNFSYIKKRMKKTFPTSKIQMVLTKDTRNEIESFHDLFDEIVDDVTVIQYNERGGDVAELDVRHHDKIKKYLKINKLDANTPYMVTADGKIFISINRLPCAQIFQRLMITYNGRVGMCCHDWGAQHCLGYIDKSGLDESKILSDLENSIKKNKKGFEILKNAKKPKIYNDPEKKVQSIEKIWNGDELNKIRDLHKEKKLDDVDICSGCNFKDTYNWVEI